MRSSSIDQSLRSACDERPETHYATTDDGVSIAYQTIGEGPVDLVLELETGATSRSCGSSTRSPTCSCGSPRSHVWSCTTGEGQDFPVARSSFPNLETRARDLLTVLDTIRSSRTVLFGERTAGAAFALFAATYPDRVSSLVWYKGVATRRWSPDYPWGSPQTSTAKRPRKWEALWAARSLAARGSRTWHPASQTTSVLRPRSPGSTDTSWRRQRLRNGSGRERDRCHCGPAVASMPDAPARLRAIADRRRAESSRAIEDPGRRASTRLRRSLWVALRESRRDRRCRRSFHRPRASRRSTPTPFSGRFCSPTSSVRPSARRRRATGLGPS